MRKKLFWGLAGLLLCCLKVSGWAVENHEESNQSLLAFNKIDQGGNIKNYRSYGDFSKRPYLNQVPKSYDVPSSEDYKMWCSYENREDERRMEEEFMWHEFRECQNDFIWHQTSYLNQKSWDSIPVVDKSDNFSLREKGEVSEDLLWNEFFEFKKILEN